MKTKFKSKLLSMLLALIMVLSIVLFGALTAFAAETEITEIKSVMSSDTVPKAGMEVRTFMPNVPDGEPYQRDWDGAEWYDSNGVIIAPTLDHHYDIGYEFEAGHTYYADYQYTANYGYVFAENPTITFTGPDPSMLNYEIVARWDNNESVTVRYTFTIPGDYENADINKVSMQYYGTPRDGAKKPDPCEVIYNNCTITSEEWNTGTWGSNANWGVYEEDGSNAPTFLAGETYVHMIKLTAKNGYKFSPGLHVQKGTQDAEEYGVVTLSDDRTVATVKFTYDIGAYEIIDTIELVAANQHVNFIPRSGESIYLPQPFGAKYALADDCPYSPDGGSNYTWVVDETGEHLHLGYPYSFEAGKSYTLKFAVRIKDEYKTTHKFAINPTVEVSDYVYAKSNDVKFKISGSGQIVNVSVTFTAQFPAGAGSSAGQPAFCYSYEQFKYAMENPNIRYVALGNVDDVISKVEGDGLIPAISVNGIKHLNVIGNATFTAPANNDGYKTIVALLHTTQGDTLTVSGAGSLKFRAVSNNSYNSVIYNQGGSVIIDGATLIGSYNTAVCGKAIWQDYGELRISDGQFFAENALAPGKLPAAHTAVYINGGQAWIQGGTFKTENKIDTIDLPYGLDIGQYATVDLSGGTFYGILLPKSSTPLANYMDEETYTPLSDESSFNPESEYSQEYVESGKVVRIAWLIDHVDIHINAPIAGVDISENYFNIPTSGCKVTMYYPQWYKNGQPVPYGTFEAGASYKVVVWVDVKADYGAEFTNGVTVAINNQSVAVDRKSSDLIAVEYDFGECPNVVPQVDLTVTAPKEGNKPSYTVGCGSDAYYAVGGSSNYTEYRTWYESSNGIDWTKMSTSTQFKAGYYYKLVVDIRTNNGYEFPLIDMGTIQPDVIATINGYSAKVIKAYDQDPSRYITVEYNFGECNDSVVEKIIIENVTAPVAGEKPNYNWSIRGNGYQMNTAKNAYEDIYWKNPPEKWYYVKNGLQWWDITTGSWEYVYENDTFIPGHTYVCQLYLIPEAGFTFATDKYNAPTVTATINGKTAEINAGWTNATEARVYYTFTCEQKEISTIMLYNLDLPVGGNVPDTSVTPAYPEYYTVESVEWFDIEGNPAGATFETGVPYYAIITVASAKMNGADMVKFADAENMNVYIDGNILGTCEVKDNKVIIPVIIRKPSSAPINPYVFVTQPVGGTVDAGQTHTAYWQTSFIPTDTEIQYWDGEAWDQWDIQQAQAAADSYDFVNADAGSYRFRIVAYMGNDAVATSNEFVISFVNEYIYVYGPGEGNGSNDFDYVTAGTQITLYTPEYMGYSPIDGFIFDYWSIRKGTAQSAEVAQKQPGEKITIDDNTYIVAMWKEAAHSKYTVAYGIGEGSGSADYETDIVFGSSFTLKAFGDVGIIAPVGKEFDYWSIRVGTAQSAETAQKQPGDTIIINDNTYIIAMWKAIAHKCVGFPESGQSATCTVDGWKDYYRCECGKYYEDANCQTPISDLGAWKIGAGKITAAHSGTPEWTKTATTHEKKYTCCDEVVIAQEAHEWNNGACSECGYVCLHKNVAVTKKDGQGATCTVDGWKDYYQCACGKYFADEACTTPIADLEVWKANDGKIVAEHKYGDLIEQRSAVHTQTELKTGMKAHYKCSVCQGYFDENKNPTTESALIIKKPEHSYGDWVKDNEKHWKVCSCGLKADEHTHNYTDNADMICNDCSYDRTVPHTCGNATKQDGQGATCTVNGWKDYYKCSCGKIYTEAACTNEITSFEEWKNGDGKIAASHSYGELIAKVDATCSVTGKQAHYKCSVCQTQFDESKMVKTENELTIAIDFSAHNYGAWTSNGDGTHTRVCSLNAEHKESDNCAGGTATCTEKAVCATCNTAYGNTAAHNYGTTWKTDENEHFNECTCGDKANKAAHTDSNNDGKCDTCEYQMSTTPDNPDDPDDKDGLGAGAIVGIVIGSIVVVGIGGFALLWFVIKKKTWAEFIAVFKKK